MSSFVGFNENEYLRSNEWMLSKWSDWVMLTLKSLNVRMQGILESYHELIPYHVLLYMNVLCYGDFKGVHCMSVLRDATCTLHQYDLGVVLNNAANMPC